MSSKMNFLFFSVMILMSAIVTPLFGMWYEKLLGPTPTGYWGPTHPEYLAAFIFAFVFFSSIFTWTVAKKDKVKYWLGYTLPLLVLMLLLGAIEELILGIVLVGVGWLIGQIIVMARGKKKDRRN